MTTIYFVRHALPDYSNPHDATMNLTAIGREDAVKVSQLLQTVVFDDCVSSPYKRTLQTIEPLAAAQNLTVRLDRRLRERERGVIGDHEDGLLKQRWQDFNFAEPGGESLGHLQQRVSAAIDDVLKREPDGTVLVSTHGAALAMIINTFNSDFRYADFMRIKNFTPYVLKMTINKYREIVTQEELLSVNHG
ncbi:histidine phosphatase family protein [Lactiplantibacillus herbarum]|uniref:histidine phosphatase family protein n=1 Tax=Lactiplantibacillus herbarum TaxID=1670446 RepID=UPI00064FB043|nr:histidine phosphatase family protein [Lactiplantibacillus herbarum]